MDDILTASTPKEIGRIKCTATTANGRPCQAWAIHDSLVAHSPLATPPLATLIDAVSGIKKTVSMIDFV